MVKSRSCFCLSAVGQQLIDSVFPATPNGQKVNRIGGLGNTQVIS